MQGAVHSLDRHADGEAAGHIVLFRSLLGLDPSRPISAAAEGFFFRFLAAVIDTIECELHNLPLEIARSMEPRISVKVDCPPLLPCSPPASLTYNLSGIVSLSPSRNQYITCAIYHIATGNSCACRCESLSSQSSAQCMYSMHMSSHINLPHSILAAHFGSSSYRPIAVRHV